MEILISQIFDINIQNISKILVMNLIELIKQHLMQFQSTDCVIGVEE
jgi:hypothetical protein